MAVHDLRELRAGFEWYADMVSRNNHRSGKGNLNCLRRYVDFFKFQNVSFELSNLHFVFTESSTCMAHK